MRLLRRFLETEAASGVVLMLAAACAMAAANSPWALQYQQALDALWLGKSLSHWINDGLMAIFFLLIGLEVKRELMEGELAGVRKALLPAFAALGGVLAPACIFLYFNAGTPLARGWAIPCATDIAFSLGVLALCGKRVPPALTVFLMAVAVIDDLIAALIIAVFYTDTIHAGMLGYAALLCAVLLGMNRSGVRSIFAYGVAGGLLWWAVLHSGVHATVAGVLLSLFVPRAAREGEPSPAGRMEEALHPWVAYGIIPIFAFANAGVSVQGSWLTDLAQPLPLGIAAGLFLGKQLGIFSASWLLVKCGWAALPTGVRWRELYGVCMVAGTGFTMSLFIGALAFPDGAAHMREIRSGIITGSLFSALLGYIFLRIVLKACAPARKQ